MQRLKPVTPGDLLLKEFLEPMGLSIERLAKEIGVPAQRIGEIVAGKRAITADTDLRLCRFFGLSDGYWLRAQAAHDTEWRKRPLPRRWLGSSRGLSSGGESRRVVMIRKLKSGQYRLYSRKKDPRTGKRRNLGTFPTREQAQQHEREVQFFKRRG